MTKIQGWFHSGETIIRWCFLGPLRVNRGWEFISRGRELSSISGICWIFPSPTDCIPRWLLLLLLVPPPSLVDFSGFSFFSSSSSSSSHSLHSLHDHSILYSQSFLVFRYPPCRIRNRSFLSCTSGIVTLSRDLACICSALPYLNIANNQHYPTTLNPLLASPRDIATAFSLSLSLSHSTPQRFMRGLASPLWSATEKTHTRHQGTKAVTVRTKEKEIISRTTRK